MSLESITYISDLVDTNPLDADAKGQGDNHLRNIKLASLNTFPNIAGEVTPTHTQMNYIKGVTANVQAHLDDLSASITGVSQAVDTSSLSYSVINARLNTLSASVAASVKIYAGKVDASGTALSLPSGWTSTFLKTTATSVEAGIYTVTHNLNTSAYAVAGNAFVNGGTHTGAYFGFVTNDLNSFNYYIARTAVYAATFVVSVA